MRGLSPTRIPNRLGGSLLGHSLEPLADLVRLATEVVEPRQRRQRLEAENTFEQSRRLVADRAGHLRVPAGFRDQAALDQPGDDRVRGNPADPGDVWTRARPEVGHDLERLHRRARETALDRTLEQPGAGFSRLARRAEGPAAGDLLEHDPASALAVTLAEQPQRRLDPLRVVVRRDSQVLDRQGLRGDDEQRLDDAREAVDRIGADQAEWAIHYEPSPSFAVTDRVPRTRMGANADACSSETSPALRSSSFFF